MRIFIKILTSRQKKEPQIVHVPVLFVLWRSLPSRQHLNFSSRVTFYLGSDLGPIGVNVRTRFKDGLTAAPYLNSELAIAVVWSTEAELTVAMSTVEP